MVRTCRKGAEVVRKKQKVGDPWLRRTVPIIFVTFLTLNVLIEPPYFEFPFERRRCIGSLLRPCYNNTAPPTSDEECRQLVAGSRHDACGPPTVASCLGTQVK